MMRSYLRSAIAHLRLKRDPISFARSRGVSIGHDCRLLGTQIGTFGSEPYLVSLADHVTITSGVQFVTHDGGVWIFRKEMPEIDVFGPISVGNNVFIGIRSIIMPGVHIGDNCVIAAGSIVTRDVPDNSIAVGIPARVIGSVEEYRTKTLSKGTLIRSLPKSEKRKWLEQHFDLKRQL